MKFDEAIKPVENWIRQQLSGMRPYSEDLTVQDCAALILQYEREKKALCNCKIPSASMSNKCSRCSKKISII